MGEKNRIVSREEWTKARVELLEREKAFDRKRDELSAARRALPWVKVDKNYVFQTETGEQNLSDLFEGKKQLIVYHFMFGPQWEEGCPSCSYLTDHYQGALEHLSARDIALVAISRGPLEKLIKFRKRMGWRHKWVSSAGTDFNQDYHVSFTQEEVKSGAYYNYKKGPIPVDELPGLSVFYKDGADIYHTYSTYGRGLDIIINSYNLIDMTPLGRNEQDFSYPMEWVKLHDKY